MKNALLICFLVISWSVQAQYSIPQRCPGPSITVNPEVEWDDLDLRKVHEVVIEGIRHEVDLTIEVLPDFMAEHLEFIEVKKDLIRYRLKQSHEIDLVFRRDGDECGLATYQLRKKS